jgi:hypothetical protein
MPTVQMMGTHTIIAVYQAAQRRGAIHTILVACQVVQIWEVIRTILVVYQAAHSPESIVMEEMVEAITGLVMAEVIIKS